MDRRADRDEDTGSAGRESGAVAAPSADGSAETAMSSPGVMLTEESVLDDGDWQQVTKGKKVTKHSVTTNDQTATSTVSSVKESSNNRATQTVTSSAASATMSKDGNKTNSAKSKNKNT